MIRESRSKANLIPLFRRPSLNSASKPGEATKDDDPETHRHEGFLKSMWHNLTNHPAHKAAQESSTDDTDSKKKNGDTK